MEPVILLQSHLEKCRHQVKESEHQISFPKHHLCGLG
jgi:hypothetical protein